MSQFEREQPLESRPINDGSSDETCEQAHNLAEPDMSRVHGVADRRTSSACCQNVTLDLRRKRFALRQCAPEIIGWTLGGRLRAVPSCLYELRTQLPVGARENEVVAGAGSRLVMGLQLHALRQQCPPHLRQFVGT